MTHIRTSTADGVTTLTIDRVAKKNSITAQMYAAMAEALQQARDDAGTRALVILGDEAVFSAGNDIADFLNHPPNSLDSPVIRFLGALAEFPKPIVAGVCGPAVGIGTTMLLHCELVYAGENAVFSLPFASLGLCPEAAASYLLPQLIGYRRAAEALLLGDRIDAQQALQMGLVNRVVAASEVAELALQQARRLAAQPLASVVETKRLLKLDEHPIVHERMQQEFVSFERMLHEPAAKEAFSAFLEGRRPDFRSVGA